MVIRLVQGPRWHFEVGERGLKDFLGDGGGTTRIKCGIEKRNRKTLM